MPFPATSVDLNIILSDGSRTEKHNVPLISLMLTISKWIEMNSLIRQIDTQRSKRKQRSGSKDNLGSLS